MKFIKVVVTWKAVYVQMEKGSTLAKLGDVLDVPENEGKILIGMKRARLFDPVLDATPVVPEPEPVPETPAPRTGRGARQKTEE